MGITDVGADAAQESRAQREEQSDYESDYERFDTSGMAFVKQHPTTAVRGTANVLRYYPDWDNDQPDRGYFGVVLEDASILGADDDEDLAGGAIFTNTEESGDDYKVVDLNDEETKELEGSGVDFAGNLFYGEQADGFEEDQIVLKATGSSGRSIASTLDVKGSGSAHSVGFNNDEEIELHDGGFPEHSGHLIEYDPRGRDNGEMPRIARDTQLRPDVEGKEIIIMVQRQRDIDDEYEGPGYWATVMVETDDDGDFTAADGTEFVSLGPTDEFEPDDDLVRDTGYILWRRVDDDVLNEAREEAGFDPYTPQGEDEAEAEA